MDMKNNEIKTNETNNYMFKKKCDSSSSLCSMDSGLESVDSRAYSIDSLNNAFYERSLSNDSQELNNLIFTDESKNKQQSESKIYQDKSILNKNIIRKNIFQSGKRRSRDKPFGRYNISKSPTVESILKILNANTYE